MLTMLLNATMVLYSMSVLKKVSTSRAIAVSFAVDLSDVILNVIVAIITGSAVMLTEALQGLSDLLSVGLLAIGHKRARRAPSRTHPFGYGKELYFWTVIAAFIMVSVTAGLSIWFGYQHFRHPDPIENVWLAYSMLCFAIASNGYAFYTSARTLLDGRKFGRLLRVFSRSPVIAPKITLVLDTMGTASAAFGLVALIIYGLTGDTRWDGIGAMLMGCVLAVLAVMLLLDIKSLVTGERVPLLILRRMHKAVRTVPEVREVLKMDTMMIGSERALINVSIHFKDDLTTDQVEQAIDDIKAAMHAIYADLVVHVEADTPPAERQAGK